MSNNRIGEQCWWHQWVWTQNADLKTGWVKTWRRGVLRAWSMDYEEFENGAANYAVGVVEDTETLMCHSVRVVRICFTVEQPS